MHDCDTSECVPVSETTGSAGGVKNKTAKERHVIHVYKSLLKINVKDPIRQPKVGMEEREMVTDGDVPMPEIINGNVPSGSLERATASIQVHSPPTLKVPTVRGRPQRGASAKKMAVSTKGTQGLGIHKFQNQMKNLELQKKRILDDGGEGASNDQQKTPNINKKTKFPADEPFVVGFVSKEGSSDKKEQHQCDICNEVYTHGVVELAQRGNCVRLLDRRCPHCKEEFVIFICDVCDDVIKLSEGVFPHECIHAGERPFKCDQCDKVYTNNSNLTQHKRIHAGETLLRCEQCDKVFLYRIHLVSHSRIHTGDKPFKCEQCDEGFDQSGNLTQHKLIVHSKNPESNDAESDKTVRTKSIRNPKIQQKRLSGTRPFKCDQCNKTYKENNHLEDHKMRKHTSYRPFKCEFCSKAFPHRNMLVLHLRTHSGEKPFGCDICGKVFTQKGSLVAHKRIHTGEKPFKCDVCDRGFAQKSSLTLHRNIHTGERAFECPDCGKTFRACSHLTDHRRIHTGYKPHICHVCDKGFRRPSYLTEHLKTHTGERPYKCEVESCEKAYVNRRQLVVHKRSHFAGKTFECDQCDKSFTTNSYLAVHKRIHTGERPFACDLCNKTFTHLESLTLHRRIHTGEKPFGCEVCLEVFAQSGTLSRHIKRRHPEMSGHNALELEDSLEQEPVHMLDVETEESN